MSDTEDDADPAPVGASRDAIPAAGRARVHVLHDGYAREDEAGDRVGSTVTLITEGDVAVIVDPGMVASRQGLLAALAAHDVAPGAVTDVVFSHHHPDHTVNAALFPAARIHDFWAVYDGDLWVSRQAEGTQLSPSIRLLATPGHTEQDISTVAATPDGVVVCTHAWWTGQGPADDPFSPDQAMLARSRQRILGIATLIVPGHGPSFRPGPGTPR
jgi:glyoxylase-like metal-dependent hydrolase (beta-lactamase superfamily II)